MFVPSCLSLTEGFLVVLTKIRKSQRLNLPTLETGLHGIIPVDAVLLRRIFPLLLFAACVLAGHVARAQGVDAEAERDALEGRHDHARLLPQVLRALRRAPHRHGAVSDSLRRLFSSASIWDKAWKPGLGGRWLGLG